MRRQESTGGPLPDSLPRAPRVIPTWMPWSGLSHLLCLRSSAESAERKPALAEGSLWPRVILQSKSGWCTCWQRGSEWIPPIVRPQRGPFHAGTCRVRCCLI